MIVACNLVPVVLLSLQRRMFVIILSFCSIGNSIVFSSLDKVI